MKFYDIPTVITRLVHDGDKEDKRLHCEEDQTTFFTEDEEAYEAIEKDIDNYCIEREKYSVYGAYDVSGFGYWVKTMRETNYIHVTISFKADDLTDEEIQQLDIDVSTAGEHFSQHQVDIDWFL